MFRGKAVKGHLDELGVREFWRSASCAIDCCERGIPGWPVHTGAGPLPARTVVCIMYLEPFVRGGTFREPLLIEWQKDVMQLGLGRDLAWMFPPNDDAYFEGEPGRDDWRRWFFPTEETDGVSWVHRELHPVRFDSFHREGRPFARIDFRGVEPLIESHSRTVTLSIMWDTHDDSVKSAKPRRGPSDLAMRPVEPRTQRPPL